MSETLICEGFAHQRATMRSGLELCPDLARLVFGAVDVDVEIAGLEARILVVGELGAGRNQPHPSVSLGQGDDRRTRLPRRTHVNVGHGAIDACRFEAPADGLVRADLNSPGPGCGSRDRRRLFGAYQLHRYVLCPG